MKEHGGGLINTDANNGDHYCENDNFDFRRMKMMMAWEVWRKSGGYKANGFVDTDRTTEALNSSIPSFTQHTVVWLADISCHKVFNTHRHFPVWTMRILSLPAALRVQKFSSDVMSTQISKRLVRCVFCK